MCIHATTKTTAADSPERNGSCLATALSQTMAALHRRGWCDGTGGNFSAVVARDPLRLLMAPSGVDKGDVEPGQLIQVDASGAVVNGIGRASAETLLHLRIVACCEAGAVLHTHSQAATLLSRWYAPDHSQRLAYLELEGYEMLKGLEGIDTHSTTVRVPVAANDQDIAGLADRSEPALATAPYGLLVAGHGLYAWGRDLATARRHLEIHEFLLEQHWRQLLLDGLLARRPKINTTTDETTA
jgi:methylthioribulose-1-phosphate dehydratase